MNESKSPAHPRLLEAAGISEPEERAYGVLLDHPGATLTQISRHLQVSTLKARQLLESIAVKGLATVTVDRVRRYLPVKPDVAIAALIVKRNHDLERMRLGIAQLRDRALASADARDDRKQVVELITGKQIQSLVLEQMQRGAIREVLCMERPPYIVTSPDQVDEIEVEAIARGVSCRNLIDPVVFDIPGAMTRLRSQEKQGEVTRVFDGVPTKLLVFDRRLSLLPLDLDDPEGPVLLVRPSALLDVLCAFFELIWERATPISFNRSGALKRRATAPRLPADTERLIPLLAAGASDKAIAHELNMSVRTLERRIVEFMAQIDARTRFQAGWLAALRLYPTLARREHTLKRKSANSG